MDGGYGLAGNMAKYLLFHDLFSDEDSEEYRKQLKKENPTAYAEYLEYEKRMEEIEEERKKNN